PPNYPDSPYSLSSSPETPLPQIPQLLNMPQKLQQTGITRPRHKALVSSLSDTMNRQNQLVDARIGHLLQIIPFNQLTIGNHTHIRHPIALSQPKKLMIMSGQGRLRPTTQHQLKSMRKQSLC